MHSLIADCIGCEQVSLNPDQVLDPLYFTHVQTEPQIRNWVYQEIMSYFCKHYGTQEEVATHFSRGGIDVLEVYCSSDSQLTCQAQNLGLKAVRFCRQHGDLGTFHGRSKLYDLLWVTKPRHVWTSPNCGPWSNWSHLNAGKSRELAIKIGSARMAEKTHLLVCDALCRLQIGRGSYTHFHLEQPSGSEMIFQGELSFIVHYTHQVKFDMCTGGNLRHPNRPEAFLPKCMQILTTSTIMHRAVEQWQCRESHDHLQIAGSCAAPGLGRIPLSRYTELYTQTFARRLGKIIQTSVQSKEPQRSNQVCEVFGILEPDNKRRRIEGKNTASHVRVQ